MIVENLKIKQHNPKPHILPILKRLVFLILIALSLTSTYSVSAQTGDSTPPTTSHVLNPADPDGESGWYISPVRVTLSAYDSGSGVEKIRWKIGDNPWQEKVFSSTLNRLKNPSFEEGSGSAITNWESAGTAGAVFLHDGTVAHDGSYSAKITNATSGWSGWNNSASDSYVVAEPFDNMSASVWIKTDNVVGEGAYFKVFALRPSGASYIGEADTKLTGTTDWTRLSLNFTVTDSDAYGVYLDIGLNGTGTVWIDNASLIEGVEDTSTDFIISQNGEPTLEYYSVDREGNEELPHHFVPLKIDTRAPGSWRDFTIEETQNEHTLISKIWVSDETSGLKTDTDKFQYSVNAGETWGYFEDPVVCNATPWIMDGWLDLSSTGNPGDKDVQLETQEVDYCDADWKVCKTIRFRTKDVAGNESYKDICINGAWSQASGQGDVYAATGINFSASGAGDNTDGLVISGGDITNFVSSQGWAVTNYLPILTRPLYAEWQERFSSLTPIDQLPTESGAYLFNGNFTIASTTIPSNLSTAAFGAVVFVSGNLTIKDDYFLGNQGALVFIVGGNVGLVVDRSVGNMAGVFFVDNSFSTGGGNSVLNVNGSILADSFDLARSLSKQDNSNDPAELFIYEPKYLELMTDLLSDEQKLLRWFEVGL